MADEDQGASAGDTAAAPDGVSASTSTTKAQRRVKLYQLNDAREWDDKGTGHVKTARAEGQLYLEVHSEDGDLLLMESNVSECCRYQRQQGTLIVWQEPDEQDLAVSFQDQNGCVDIWAQICEAKGMDPEGTGETEAEDESMLDMEEHEVDAPTLPEPDMKHLEEIAGILVSVTESKQEITAFSFHQCESVSNQIVVRGFIPKLLEIFTMCEDLESDDGLNHIFRIFKSIVLLGQSAIFDVLFEDDNIVSFFGTLERDPERKTKSNFRDFIEHTARFKEVVPIKNEKITKLIHKTYRIQYFKDVVAVNFADDTVTQLLSTYVLLNNIQIVDVLKDDKTFLPDLFASLRDTSGDPALRRDQARFVLELLTTSQQFAPPVRGALHTRLDSLDLLGVVQGLLSDADEGVRGASAGILGQLLDHEPQGVRQHILRRREDPSEASTSIMSVLCERLALETHPASMVQISENLSMLLDKESFEIGQSSTEILQKFWEPAVIGHLLEPVRREYTGPLSRVDEERILRLLGLLEVFLPQHSYHAKNYVLKNAVLPQAMTLMGLGSDLITLSAIRLLRAVIGTCNEFYNRHIVKHQLFAPVMAAFVRNGPRYNLLNSSVLDILDYIRKKNIKSLVSHVAVNFKEELQGIGYVPTCENLLVRHEQNENKEEPSVASAGAGASSMERYRLDGSMDQREQDYFDTEDEPPSSDSGPNTQEEDVFLPALKRSKGISPN